MLVGHAVEKKYWQKPSYGVSLKWINTYYCIDDNLRERWKPAESASFVGNGGKQNVSYTLQFYSLKFQMFSYLTFFGNHFTLLKCLFQILSCWTCQIGENTNISCGLI